MCAIWFSNLVLEMVFLGNSLTGGPGIRSCVRVDSGVFSFVYMLCVCFEDIFNLIIGGEELYQIRNL